MTNFLLLWYNSRMSNSDISYILPNIYISNCKTANNEELLKKYNITSIINISNSCVNNYYGHIDYNRLSIKSNYSKKRLYKYINIISADIDGMHNRIINGHNILVHCRHGIQRACMYVAVYLMKYYNYNMKDVLEFIKSKRPIAFFRKNKYEFLLKEIEKKFMINKLNNNFNLN